MQVVTRLVVRREIDVWNLQGDKNNSRSICEAWKCFGIDYSYYAAKVPDVTVEAGRHLLSPKLATGWFELFLFLACKDCGLNWGTGLHGDF